MRRKWGMIIIAVVLFCSGCSGENIEVEETVKEQIEVFGDSGQLKLSVYNPEASDENVPDYSENESIIKFAEKHNISFCFYQSAWGEEAQDVEEMFFSRKFFDIMYLPASISYKGGSDQAVKDNVFWDLTEYVEKYMPNYCRLIQSDENLRRNAYNDDGRIVGLLVIPYNTISQTVADQMAVGGMIIRKDWLDNAGLDLPVTYDDWEEMLTVFRDIYSCEQPLYISSQGYSEKSPGFSSGFGAIPSMQMNGDMVEYGPATEGWKAYVTLMHNWYEKGLIGPEYIANDVYGIDEKACIDEETGAMLCVYHKVDAIEAAISENADFCAVQYPVAYKGQTAQAGDKSAVIGKRSIYVTTAVSEEELPKVLEVIDDLYCIDTAFELTYGTERDTYIYDEDGNIKFTDKIVGGENGYTALNAMETYLIPSNLMTLKDVQREMAAISSENMEMCQVWDKDGADLYMPSVTLTAAEQQLYDSIMMDVEPYMKEMTNRMIVGATDIETGWTNYINTLNEMGIEKAVKCYQDAYNRYIHR